MSGKHVNKSHTARLQEGFYSISIPLQETYYSISIPTFAVSAVQVKSEIHLCLLICFCFGNCKRKFYSQSRYDFVKIPRLSTKPIMMMIGGIRADAKRTVCTALVKYFSLIATLTQMSRPNTLCIKKTRSISEFLPTLLCSELPQLGPKKVISFIWLSGDARGLLKFTTQ